jgi:L-aspartate oxidase
VSLDMREVDPELFPNVVAALRQAGIDPVHQLVPVAPAAHYVMGGIATDLEARSTLPSLYAVGECSCTGVHGANRLASNSLTECFVFGARAARAAARTESGSSDEEPAPPAGAAPVRRPSAESRQALWRDAGIERDADGLRRLTGDDHPLVRLIAGCALTREESRGAHQRRDFPDLETSLDGHHVTVTGAAKPVLTEWV